MNSDQTAVPGKKERLGPGIELLIILVLGIAVYLFAATYDILERIVGFSQQHENWELDEFITVSCFFMFSFIYFSVRRWIEVRKANKLLQRQNTELKRGLAEIKQLRGIIPICASCKQVRDDKGFWHQVESYFRKHSEATFSHSICPECMSELYPDTDGEDE